MQNKTLILIIILAALLGGIVAATVTTHFGNESTIDLEPLQAQIGKLEEELASERRARETLEQLVSGIEPSRPVGVPAAVMRERMARLAEAEAPQVNDEIQIDTAAEPNAAPDRRELKRQILVSGGFSNEEANWVAEQESQVELEYLFQQHRWQRDALAKQSSSENPWIRQTNRSNMLRERLGDDAYERYLKANGAPAVAEVRSIIENSPADAAGLQAGDKITAYNGQRVFDMRDVRRLTFQGEEGEPVLLEVERDGNSLQLSIPRGPIGVSGNY